MHSICSARRCLPLLPLAALLLVAACRSSQPSSNVPQSAPVDPATANVLDAERTCTRDDECAFVDVACCACSMGGQRTAAQSAGLPTITQRRLGACAEVGCLAAISDHPSCAQDTRVACTGGVCTAVTTGAPDVAKGVGIEPISVGAPPAVPATLVRP